MIASIIKLSKYTIEIFRTNLHISNEKCKQYQTSNGNENRKADFPNIGTCFQVLTKRAAIKESSSPKSGWRNNYRMSDKILVKLCQFQNLEQIRYEQYTTPNLIID